MKVPPGLPLDLEAKVLAAIAGGRDPATLAVHWRAKSSDIVTRADLGARLQRSGARALAGRVLHADVPRDRVLVYTDLAGGRRSVALATCPWPAVVVAPPPSSPVDVVIIAPRPRPRGVARPATSASYLAELERCRARPGIPRGRCHPRPSLSWRSEP